MEAYSNSVIPLTEFTTAIDVNGSSSRNRAVPKVTKVESIQKERERREKMSEMFSLLQSIVPNLYPKATRERIVSDTIQYIQRLEEERERLESLKKSSISPESMESRPTLTSCVNQNQSVEVAISGSGVVFFEIEFADRRNLATEILPVFEKHKAEVLAATVSVNGDHWQQRSAVTVTALVGGDGDNVEMIKREILNL